MILRGRIDRLERLAPPRRLAPAELSDRDLVRVALGRPDLSPWQAEAIIARAVARDPMWTDPRPPAQLTDRELEARLLFLLAP